MLHLKDANGQWVCVNSGEFYRVLKENSQQMLGHQYSDVVAMLTLYKELGGSDNHIKDEVARLIGEMRP